MNKSNQDQNDNAKDIKNKGFRMSLTAKFFLFVFTISLFISLGLILFHKK